MARRNFVNDIITKVQMGDIYRIQFEDLTLKIDSLLDQGMDAIAERHKKKLLELNEKIKESEEAETELAGMIERAKLTPMEYLLFELRYMQAMTWNEIATKICSTPQLKRYVRCREVYFEVLKNATKKIKEAGE